MKAARWFLACALTISAVLGACGGNQEFPARAADPSTALAPAAIQQPAARPKQTPRRDLSIDESMGGHTLARHVGKSDAELRARLKRERRISAASTYTDREIAETTVAAAIASSRGTLENWLRRKGRRPNLVLRYDADGQTLGRSLARGQRTPAPAERALIVLRWDEREERYYVLTSYPEAEQ
jgi:hypothetical protein